MSHWTINDGELRRQVGMQTERYRELRRRSDEARLLDAARGPRRSMGESLRSWLQAMWRQIRRTHARERVSSDGLEHGRG